MGTTDIDSATDFADSGPLTTGGSSDDSLDFGFVQSVSVGDRVWHDTNGNGIQDGEPGIGGVTLTITGPDGPVTDVFGDPVGPVVTGDDGSYTFENLPVLTEGQQYLVAIDRVASADVLAGYLPTRTGQGTRASDSSTWTSGTEGLTQGGQSDTTLDFGFVQAVSVGDRVWHDTDRDGVQGAGEPGIGGVTLTITGPGGGEVTDVFGNPVGAVETDADGNYRFENLPVLADGQSYRCTW